MCDHENTAQGSETNSPTFLNIPDLPFGIICSFLDISTLMNLRLVCKTFNSYIKREISLLREYKKRAKDIWSDAVYPIFSPANPDKLFWRRSCEALQKEKTLWTQNAYPLVEIVKREFENQRNCCSPLYLMHDGSAYIFGYDCYLYYNKIESKHIDICKEIAHPTHIMDLTILNNKIYSCSLDSEHIKSWNINNGFLQMETSYNFGSECPTDWPNCLSSYAGQNVFAVGSQHGLVTVFDSRSRNRMLQYKVRREDRYTAIFNLVINPEYIFSAFGDNIISVYDQRARRLLDNIEIGNRSISCMKMQQDCILIGDDMGKLLVLSPKNNFEVKTYDIGHTCGMVEVHLTYGSLITTSYDTIIISSPTDPPKHMRTFNLPFTIRSVLENKRGNDLILSIILKSVARRLSVF